MVHTKYMGCHESKWEARTSLCRGASGRQIKLNLSEEVIKSEQNLGKINVPGRRDKVNTKVAGHPSGRQVKKF